MCLSFLRDFSSKESNEIERDGNALKYETAAALLCFDFPWGYWKAESDSMALQGLVWESARQQHLQIAGLEMSPDTLQT